MIHAGELPISGPRQIDQICAQNVAHLPALTEMQIRRSARAGLELGHSL